MAPCRRRPSSGLVSVRVPAARVQGCIRACERAGMVGQQLAQASPSASTAWRSPSGPAAALQMAAIACRSDAASFRSNGVCGQAIGRGHARKGPLGRAQGAWEASMGARGPGCELGLNLERGSQLRPARQARSSFRQPRIACFYRLPVLKKLRGRSPPAFRHSPFPIPQSPTPPQLISLPSPSGMAAHASAALGWGAAASAATLRSRPPTLAARARTGSRSRRPLACRADTSSASRGGGASGGGGLAGLAQRAQERPQEVEWLRATVVENK